jgi:ATP-binding cassette subfamily B protein IrtA
VTVTAVHDFTPWYRRVTFSAPDLVKDLDVFPTLWLRLWVPHPAKGDGYVSQRGYTLVDVRPDAGTFALDFVLHDVSGPAGDWARQAHPGEELEVALTPAHIGLPEGTASVLLAGDVTALPAINTWLEAIPPEVEAAVWVEDDHEGRDGLPRTDRAGTAWTWVEREGPRGAALAEAVAATAPAPGRYAWAAGEKSLVQAVRPVLRDRLGLDRAHQFTQFYWIEGRSTG